MFCIKTPNFGELKFNKEKSMMPMKTHPKRLDNCSYIFIPFYSFSNLESLKELVIKSEKWTEQDNTYKYFLKYISDKLSLSSATYCVQQFSLSNEKRKELGILDSSTNCYMSAKKSNESRHPFSFKIKEISLYTFDTNIGILVFKILHPVQDSYGRVATKCYHLKKVYLAKLYIKNQESLVTGYQDVNNIYDLAKYLLDCTAVKEKSLFFNYTNVNEYRSNILTHYGMVLNHPLDNSDSVEIKKILFYLRRNYYSQWTYNSENDEGEENYSPSPYIHWGITTEGTACVTVIDPKVNFVTNSFHKNFHSYYLVMYILCLHQKLALYNYLSMFSADLQNKPEIIDKYLKNLAEFRAKYVFEIISESETYQTVYEKTRQAFGLGALFNDIEDQVRRINEIQKTIAEDRQTKLENRISIIGSILGFFCVFSTLVDVQELLEKFSWLLGEQGVNIAQQISSIIIVIISLIMIIVFLLSLKRSKLKKQRTKRKKKNRR